MTFTLSYNSQTINAEVITNSFSKTEVYWNKLKQADNSARFQAVFTIELSNFIKANINNDIQVTIADGDTNVFFGYVRKNVRFTKTQINQPVSIEVVSPSFLLDKSIGKTLNYINKTLGYIVEDLLSRADFNSTQGLSSLSYAPKLISVTEEETFKDVITELLYEYGYGWDFDASGVFFVYELFTTPTIAEVTNTFDGSNCLNQIDITAKDSEYDCVKGEFSEISEHTNALIFTDTTNGSTQSKCSQPVLSHKYFADKQYNYLDCDSEFGEIKFISSVTPDVTASNGPHMTWQMSDKELDSSSPNYNLPLGTQLCFTAYNSAGDTNYLTKIDCKANILVGNTKTSAISYGNKKTNEISLKYICEESKASSFVQNLTNWYRYSNNTISLTSKTNYALGSFVKVTDYGIGTYYGRIIQKTTNLVTDSISYIIETFESFTAATVDTKSTPAIGGLNQSSIQNAINQSNSYTDNQIREVELEASPQYSVLYNSPVVRKGNDGSYTPSVISAKAYKTQNAGQALFSGDFVIKVNGQSYGTITGSSISLSIDDLLAEYDSLDTVEITFQTSGVSPIVISQYTIPVISGASAYSVILETPSTVFEGNENGVVSAHTVTTKAHVYYGLQELEYLGENGWEYGAIEPPEGFTVSVNASTGVVSITNEAGNIPEYGKITIPVFIHSQTNTEFYAGYVGEQRASVIYYSGYGDHFEGYLTPDENGYFNAYFTWVKVTETAIKLSQLDTKVNGYWNTITNDLVVTVPEKNTLARILDGFVSEYTVYAQKYSSHRTYAAYNTAFTNVQGAINTILSYDGNYTFNGATEKNTFNAYFSSYYSTKESLDAEIATVGTNFTGVDTVNEINELSTSAKVGDYFVWTGDNNTEAGGVTFVTGMTYCWNGTGWEEDEDRTHIMATMDEAMSKINGSTSDSIPAVSFAKRLIAMQVVTNDLVAKYATVQNLTVTNGNVTALSTNLSENYSSNTQLGTSGTTEIHGGNIKTETIDVDKLIVNDAFMDALATRVLNLQNGGIIKSDNWNGTLNEEGTDIATAGTTGFIELANGKAEFNNKVVATNLEIKGNSTFNGTGTFTGTVNANSGNFNNVTVSSSCEIYGPVGDVINISGKTYSYKPNVFDSNYTELLCFYSKEKKTRTFQSQTKTVEVPVILGAYLVSWSMWTKSYTPVFSTGCNVVVKKLYEPTLTHYVSVVNEGTDNEYLSFTNPSTNADNSMLSYLRFN